MSHTFPMSAWCARRSICSGKRSGWSVSMACGIRAWRVRPPFLEKASVGHLVWIKGLPRHCRARRLRLVCRHVQGGARPRDGARRRPDEGASLIEGAVARHAERGQQIMLPGIIAPTSARSGCSADTSRKRTPTRARPGTASPSSSRSLPLISGMSRKTPVMFPAGRARLATNPAATGSLSRSTATTGTLDVRRCAAMMPCGLVTTSTSTPAPTVDAMAPS